MSREDTEHQPTEPSWRVRARHFYKALNIYKLRWSPFERRAHRQTDVYMLWFPKTGGTWVRLLINGALQRHTGITPEVPLDFEAFERADPPVPRIRAHNDDEPHWKTPAQLETDKKHFRNHKVILLVRDPRDTVVSLWFQKTKRWRTYERSLHEFVREPSGSVQTMIAFYNVWAKRRDDAGEVLLVRYEDIHEDPVGTLRRMLDFAGLDAVSDEVVAQSVEAADFDRMRKREAKAEWKTSRLRPGDPEDRESFKARRGKVGGYHDYLSAEDVAWVTDLIERELDPWYGYGAATHDPEPA